MIAISITSDHDRQITSLSTELIDAPEENTRSSIYSIAVRHEDNKAYGEIVFEDIANLLDFRDALLKIIDIWQSPNVYP